jgi:UDP-glucose 4-epimerase
VLDNIFWKKKRVLLIGGLGFIGSNLIHSLIGNVKSITVVEKSMVENSWKYKNNKDILSKINLIIADALELNMYENELKHADIIFNLVANFDKNSLDSHKLNLDFNIQLLDFLKEKNNKAIIVHFGSRLEYGKPKKIPVNEEFSLNPVDNYSKDKIKSEKYFVLYNKKYGLKTICLRISNPYGPRGIIDKKTHNIINYAIGTFLKGETFVINGEGLQIKDYIYIHDLVDALIILVQNEKAYGQIYNIGYGKSIKFKEAFKKIHKYINKGGLIQDEKKENEDYDFLMDITKISEETGWKPITNFDNGIKKTIEYYKGIMK